MLLLCIIGFFIKGAGYKAGASIILFLYSIVPCVMFILIYLFFPPNNWRGYVIDLIFLLIILLNFILSVLMMKRLREEIKE